jgi:thiol:disulfide interchange protein DsbD
MSKRFSYLIVCFTTIFCLLAQLAFTTDSFAANSSSSGFNAFTDDDDDDEFLHPDEAFKLNVVAIGNDTLEGIFTVEPGYYLYKDRVKFDIKDATLGTIKTVDLPAGDIKDDPHFGKQEVYHHDFVATINTENTAQDLVIHARFQGCSEKGLCYAPQLKTYQVNMAEIAQTQNNANSTSPIANANNTPQNGEDEATSLLKSGKLWLIAAGFFGFGLLLSFTPCVLPMIPILSGIIVGDKKAHHHETSRLHSFNLSLAYVLGIALSYTIAGIAAGLSGQLLSNALQSPWMLTITAFIFVILSFSMFGFYELRLPHSVEDRMVNTTNKLKGGQLLGVFVMGVISALIVSPCVAAPLAGALLYISQTRDVILGGVALFSLSIGMGVPLLLIGASAGHVLPKAGGWMTAVRNFFGILMLAVAIYIVSPIIPTTVQMVLWSALLIIPAIYLHALDNLPLDSETGRSHPWMRFWKGVGIMLLIVGIAMLIGAVSGAKSPLQPLSGLTINSNAKQESHLPFVRVKNTAELDAKIDEANGKVVMLDFYADWCTSCKEMELFTFSDPAVKKALQNVVLLQADVTANSPEDLALLQRFNLFGPPGIIFFNRSGQEIKPIRVIGFEDAPRFLATVNRVNALKADECNPLVAC